MKDFKDIILMLDDTYNIEIEHQDNVNETIPIRGIEIDFESKVVILKNW